MDENTTWCGIDDHKENLEVGAVLGQAGAESMTMYRVPTEKRAVKRLARRLVREAPGEVVCCYEAGPLGYSLQRWLESGGVRCCVAAPSLTPVRPGEKIKTDRRDARKLALLLRSGMLELIQPPSEAEEAVRDVCRQRDQVRRDCTASKQRLSKFLLRCGLIWRKRAWTLEWEKWLNGITFDNPLSAMVLSEYRQSIEEHQSRLKSLDEMIVRIAQQEEYRLPVAWLRCFRGFETLTSLGLTATLYAPERFRSAGHVASFVGLVPSEHSTGPRVRRGPITRTGNSLARRLLIEAAWNQRTRPRVSKALARRREGQPQEIIQLADRVMKRLHRKFTKLLWAKKPPNVAATAVARELAGNVWTVLLKAKKAGIQEVG